MSDFGGTIDELIWFLLGLTSELTTVSFIGTNSFFTTLPDNSANPTYI